MYIIIKTQHKKDIGDLRDLEDLVVTVKNGDLRYFYTLDGADVYKEENTIDGQIIEVPIY